jgi:S-layer homology domain
MMGFFRRGLLSALLTVGSLASAWSAPLFPDLPTDHWAQDAVATLAAKGLVEGYPDGTFKGDRSASRWETAMVVARLLANMEQAHSTFASKAELAEIRKLAVALREELDALGVRVDHLEESVGRIDKRVTELERIAFYGSVETRVNFHTFGNQGNHLSDPTDALLNYDAMVGTAQGAGAAISSGPAAGQPFDPFAFGAFNVTNLDKGTPLVNGTGFTSLATLGLNVVVTEEVDARAEFKAFTSQGNALTGLYYGVSAPYLSNLFTGMSTVTGGIAGLQSSNHTPFTRMALDHFWVHHKPSNIRVRAGSISNLKFDELVYQKQYNPNAFSPAFLDSYGLQVQGQQDIGEGQNLSWEVLGTLLPDRNAGVAGAGYFNQAWGGNLAYNFQKDHGQVKLNFLRATNDASGGAARQVGLINAVNNNPVPWVNPNGFYFNQLGGPNQATGGIGSLGDVRPIPMPNLGNDGVTGIPGQANFGNMGPQAQDMYGVTARYNWGGDFQPYLKGEYAHTDYHPNQNSGYTADGDAFRLSAGASFFEDTLSVDAEYLAVDPTYDPFVLQIPPAGGFLFNGYRLGEDFLNTRGDLYTLHDTSVYPHNREGFRGKLTWDFADEGTLGVRFGFLEQRRASLQDVRYSTGSLGPATPNTPVLGFSPGFVEPVFGGFSPFTFAPAGGNALATPLESPKGTRDSVAIDAKYRWTVAESQSEDDDYWSRGLTLTAGFNTVGYKRSSQLRSLLPGPNGISGESVNNVDLSYTSWGVNLDYDLTPTFNVNAGYSEFAIKGHYDPYGIYSAYAIANNTTTFDNFNLRQSQPTVGFDYAISESINWDLATVFLSTKDRVSSSVFSTPVTPGLNNVFTPQRSVHPFSFDGIMVNTRFNLSF